MAEPYLSEIRMMAFDFPPQGWALCDGTLLSIQDNQALFGLLGTTYGGDGVDTFALPDLRGRTAIHAGGGHALGESGGEAAHALAETGMPAHLHTAQGTAAGATTNLPGGSLLAAVGTGMYGAPTSLAEMSPTAVAASGGGLPHENRQPFLALTFCIALQGSLPSTATL